MPVSMSFSRMAFFLISSVVMMCPVKPSFADIASLSGKSVFMTFGFTISEKINYYSAKGGRLGSETNRRKSTQGLLIRQRGGKLYIAFPDADDVIVDNKYVISSGIIAVRGKKECVKFAIEAGATEIVCANYDYGNGDVVNVRMTNSFPDEDGEGSAVLSFRFDGRNCTFIRYSEKNILADYYAPFLAGPPGGGNYTRAERILSREANSGKCSVR